jgi:hypothetical protein
LTAPRLRRGSGNYVMAASRLAKTLSANAEIDNGGSCGVMIRSLEKRNGRFRRGTSRRAKRDHSDDPLRVLIRILARRAARERFERESAAQGETSPEVTVQ